MATVRNGHGGITAELWLLGLEGALGVGGEVKLL